MPSKGTIYRIVENITPPFIFKWFRNSIVYSFVIKILRKYSTDAPTEILEVPKGDIAGFKLKFDPTGVWQQEMLQGTYDSELFTYLKRENLTGKTVYDIGAHIGYHSLLFSTYVGDTGKVFTFEPNPANVTRIKEIISLNPKIEKSITVLDMALSDTNGTTPFLSTNNIENGTSSGGFIDEASTIWTRETYTKKVGFKTTDVQIKTIDTLVHQATILPPDVLKIDVEGAEQLVLKGAEATIKMHHPIILIEFHSIYSTFMCMQILSQYNYTFTVLKKEQDGRLLIAAR